jgi:hypothetical protein
VDVDVDMDVDMVEILEEEDKNFLLANQNYSSNAMILVFLLLFSFCKLRLQQ